MDWTAPELLTWLATPWGRATALASALVALTMLAGSLLARERREEIALWLMGAHTAETWHRSFTALFDAVFGRRHLSLRCFAASTLASLLAVCLIWLLMGRAGLLALRAGSELTLAEILTLALVINVLADYASLLETRWLLSRMPRHWLAQLAILALDLVLTTAIIWLAIFAYLQSPLHQGEIETFAEILGVFSIFSVFFYSTFLTSAWTCSYIGSTWLMKAFARLNLAHWLDVEHQPVRILALTLGTVTFAGTLALSGPLTREATGPRPVERALCTLFKGRVCMDVAALTQEEAAQLTFITLACEGGVTHECLDRAFAVWDIDAVRAATFLRASCDGGEARGCTNLGYLHERGIGMDPDPAAAARLYRQGCDSGDALGCTNLGYLHQAGIGMDPDPAEAARLYRQGCDGGEALGCAKLGYLHEEGIGVDRNPKEAARLYRLSCDEGLGRGCVNLGTLYEVGEGVGVDGNGATELYQRACIIGDQLGCRLVALRDTGKRTDYSSPHAFDSLRHDCDEGMAMGCIELAAAYEAGIGEWDLSEAARLYRQGCDLGHSDACDWAQELFQG